MECSIVVATYGDAEWIDTAHDVALPSARAAGLPIVIVHGASLHEARNAALDQVRTESVVFLDADDELEADYLDVMAASSADVRVPSVRYVRNNFDQGVRMPTIAGHSHVCTPECLALGNYIVIGAVARTQLLRDVGGFRDFPWSEDWDLWVRCWKAGATFENVPGAIYRAHVRTDSRNRGVSVSDRIAAHNLIAEANDLPLVLA